MKDKKYADLPLIPESVLKKRHDLDELKRKKAANDALKGPGKMAHPSGKKAVYVKKPETILAQARSRIHTRRRFRRVLKKGMQTRASNDPQFEEREIEDNSEVVTKKYQSNSVGANVVFCVRIRDNHGVDDQVAKLLKRLRLGRPHTGVFLRYDEATRQRLHLIEPWVVYGPVTRAQIADLIERRGHGRVGKERVPLSDNTIIENALGEYGMVCKEDLIEEIAGVGEHFMPAVKFLWPFTLADHKTQFERRTLKLKDGKDYGDRGEAIADYIKEVL